MRRPFYYLRFSSHLFLLTISLVLCISVSVIASHTLVTTDHSGLSVDESDLPKISDIRRSLKAFMKNSKRVDEPEIQRAAIFNLCQLHSQVVNDPRFVNSHQLQGMRVVAANRLKDYARQVRNQDLRSQREKEKSNSSRSESQPASPTVSTVDDEYDNEYDAAAYDSAYETMTASGTLTGGPQQLFGYLGGNFAPPWDHGEELVRLIENTINPDFWQRNGGEGRIHYFRPLRVLVVGASTQVQEETLDLLRKLRYAGQ